ncbi:MAG TPA: hypothetical protein PLA83_01685 [Deltaproteobacteria bacterium]|nr:hypothetical protein [Deltaproteobacteria bacterium]HQH99754.1 hypothetical protein [Deltaproteobacteria bacterium]HQJ08667.1 hypothetical protein [Deltaproteobacteria bacterium]
MGFIRMKGVEGLLYVPNENGGAKKHPCEDCHFCQWCSDNRCSLCLDQKSCCGKRPAKECPSPGEDEACRKKNP